MEKATKNNRNPKNNMENGHQKHHISSSFTKWHCSFGQIPGFFGPLNRPEIFSLALQKPQRFNNA